MRVWVDLTNSPHVLVFRPLIRLLRERGHEVEVTAREYAQTLQLLELHGIEATVDRAARRRLGARQGARRVCAPAGAPALGEAAPLRPRAGHGSHDLTLTARSLASRARPRSTTSSPGSSTSSAAARRRGSSCRRRSRRSGSPVRRCAEEAPPLPRPEGGVLPRRLRALAACRRAGGRRACWSSPARRRGLALPPARQPALPRRSTGSAASASHVVVLPRTDEQRADPRPPPALVVVPDRAVEAQSLIAPPPRRLGRRDDEPRSGRARDAGLHDVRGPARRGGRAADPRGAPGQLRDPRRSTSDGTSPAARAPTTRTETLLDLLLGGERG